MSEQNETVNVAKPVDPAKSTRNKIGVGIFLLVTLIGAMTFVYFTANLVKKPLGTSPETNETSEVQKEARRDEGEGATRSVLLSNPLRTSSSVSKLR